MSKTCIICYTNIATKPICCSKPFCSQCLTNWAHTRIVYDRIKREINIKCPYYDCDKNLAPIDLIHALGVNEFEKINNLYTELYISSTTDVRRCPNQNCKYAGFVSFQQCEEPLECENCSLTWHEYEHLSSLQKLSRSLKDFISLNSDSFSYINEVLTGSPCPTCGMVIWKEGGCNHMACQKCNHEFCWQCHGDYSGYNHTSTTYCSLRKLITLTLTLPFLLILCANLGMKIPGLGWLIHFILEKILIFLIPHLLSTLNLVKFFMLASLIHCASEYSNFWRKILQLLKVPLFVIVMISPLQCENYQNSQECDVAKTLCWQFWVWFTAIWILGSALSENLNQIYSLESEDELFLADLNPLDFPAGLGGKCDLK
ncbi:unnamed protein product [Moneuplotes crassus]|uniref:RBR-type E3 ubiquitin transferase n=1 Tax=Euplotes crassus TaxID=5936 RepID=A0AAD1XGV3_EUPCR|nr:unnamed protein product [Moneuplotes crassus]